MPKNFVRENVPLSRFGVLVAQLESIVASSSQQPPDAILCFDLLSDLTSAIHEEPKESILLWQRKCEDALYSLLILGAKRPVRHLASVAMATIISKGDTISIYSRVSTLQGFLSDGKKSEPQRVAGAAQCLGELYQHFGRRITSGLLETTVIAAKLVKFNEEFVRQEALLMLHKALEGCGGTAASAAYSEAFRLITRFAVGDKSFVVRIAAARCLKAFASIGGPGLGVGELDSLATICVKALEDPLLSVRDAFAEALGVMLALGMNPDKQVQPKGKGPFPPAKKLDSGLHRHFALPFMKANGTRSKDIRIGIALSWVSFLQTTRLKYLHPDSELQNYALQVLEMLHVDTSVDAHALACILYILRIGVTDQMTEPTQRGFLVFLGKQVESHDAVPAMKIAALRTLSYTLKTLGEVPLEFKEVLDDAIFAAASHSSQLVRIETALTIRVLAEVDPTCVGGLISYGLTTLGALRENVSFEKGSNLKVELDSLHGQATTLAALVSISPKLPLGYPSRLPRSVLEVSKKMLNESSRNSVAATVEKEAGWFLLSSLLSSMPKQELEDQVFDILSLWAVIFSGNPEQEIKKTGDLKSKINVWSAAVEALSAFVRCFISINNANSGILLQPVLVYLSCALSYILLLQDKEQSDIKPAMGIFIIRTLVAYQNLPDPMAYKSEHPKIIQLCSIPYRDASRCEESSCLRLLLDKRDAWLGPWIPGRDWFEDELRAFQGEKDGLMPCVWEDVPSSFPMPETINKTLVNQMLLCLGNMFACQDSSRMLSLLGMMEQCLKAGKKQVWHASSVTNICVGLLSGLKALISVRPQPLGLEILNAAQAIFQNILAEGDLCASQRRASSEGLGLLARLGNDIFTARMTRMLLGDLTTTTDSSYAGSVAFALGCIHRSAGGMALSSLVPATVSSMSLLAKSVVAGLQIWSLHGLLLTIEAAGFSYVSHVQSTLGLAMEILLSEENGLVDLQQGVGRLINAIVAVLGPELAPGSIFFSRCKSVIAEISSQQETATLLESVRFTQQLVLFAPQAVSVHSHVQTLLSTLSSRQPTLRHLAVSTLRHLIEKDPDSIIEEEIEKNLFHMLDEETDSEIGSLVRTTIMRLLHASCPTRPFHWMLVCRNMVLAMSSKQDTESGGKTGNNSLTGPDNDSGLDFGEDDDTMVSTSVPTQGYGFQTSGINHNRDKHLRYRTRVFAAECLSHLPNAVGMDPAHFDLALARECTNGQTSRDWLVLHVQELISLAYQISTIQFEIMRPVGVGLLSAIIDKFESIPDPELPGHLLMEQYQAQLVSAVRTSLDASSGPVLLEAGLQLATKIMTSGILGGDQVAVKRIFSLISRPLNEFKELYYPSFAEWVSCKIKIRLLAAHASLKCYTFSCLRRHHNEVSDENLALLPLFSKSSSVLGRHWIHLLTDYCYISLCLDLTKNWNPFLDGIQSPLVSSKLQPSLEEAWPVILQALALDAVPANIDSNLKTNEEDTLRNNLISGYRMVELELEEYKFLWGFALLVLFQQQNPLVGRQIIQLSPIKFRHGGDSPLEEPSLTILKLYEIVLPVFQFLSTERFFTAEFLTMDICCELLKVLSYSITMENAWNSLAISVLSQIVHNCPDIFLEHEDFSYLAAELLLAYIFNVLQSSSAKSSDLSWETLASSLFVTAKTLAIRVEPKKHLKSLPLALWLAGYKCIRKASNESCLSTAHDLIKCTSHLLKKIFDDSFRCGDDEGDNVQAICGTCLNVISDMTYDCIKGIHLLENKPSDLRRLLQLKLSFSLEQTVSFAKLVFELEHQLKSEDSNSIFLSVVNDCKKCFQDVLKDSNLQVKAIGLQVIKTMMQKSSNPEDSTFLVFFGGELVSEILILIQTMLKKPMTKEAVTIAGECLRFLVILQTLSKSSECQKGFVRLLVTAAVMVFSATENDSSWEVSDIRNSAIKLVSHLAQNSLLAVHLKEIMLSMPVTYRQQMQEVIRASVEQDHNVTHTKPTTPLEIKLPVPKDSGPSGISKQQMEESTERISYSTRSVHSEHESLEEDQEDEDDWDAFQSFPASTSAAGTDAIIDDAAEASISEKDALEIKSEHDGIHEFSVSEDSQTISKSIDVTGDDHELTLEEKMSGSIPGETSKMREPDDIQITDDDSQPYENLHQNDMDVCPVEDREEGADAVSSHVNISNENITISSDLVHVNTEGLRQVDLTDEYKQSKESPIGSIDVQELQNDSNSDDQEGPLQVNEAEANPPREHDPHNENDTPVTSDDLPPKISSESESHGETRNEADRTTLAEDDERDKKETETNDQRHESIDQLDSPEGHDDDDAKVESLGEIDRT